MPRSHKRYGNDGGGFPLGQILAVSLGGGGANPAMGATPEAAAAAGTSQEGLVDYRYKGDPSEAISKYGTDKPFRPNNPFQKLYGMDDADKANESYTLGKLESQDRLASQKALEKFRADQEIQQIARLAVAHDSAAEAARGRLVARLAPEVQMMARTGELPDLGLPSPIDPNTPAGAQAYANSMSLRYPGLDKGIYPSMGAGETARNTALGRMFERPGLQGEVTAKQDAETGKANLEALKASQESGTRLKYPERVEAGQLGEFDSPALAADKARNQLPWSKYFPFDGVLLTDPNNLMNGLTVTPAVKGGEPRPGPNGGIEYTKGQPPMPLLLDNGDVIRPKHPLLNPGVAAGTSFRPSPTPPMNIQKPAAPLTPTLGTGVNSVSSLSLPYESPETKAAKQAVEREAAAKALEALKLKLRGINMAY